MYGVQKSTTGVIPQASSTSFLLLRTVLVLKLVKYSRLTGQWAPGIHLSLLSQSWDEKCISYQICKIGSGSKLRSSCFHNKHFTPGLFSQPIASLHMSWLPFEACCFTPTKTPEDSDAQQILYVKTVCYLLFCQITLAPNFLLISHTLTHPTLFYLLIYIYPFSLLNFYSVCCLEALLPANRHITWSPNAGSTQLLCMC